MMMRTFRKAAALLGGMTLIGATLVGAYDLGSYPATFVKDGKFSGQIVLGENARTGDVMGAIDIAAGLQSVSTTKSGISNAAYLTGDVKSVNGGKLLLRKKVSTTLTGSDLKGFATGKVTNSRGTTEYKQYMRFGSTGFSPLTVNYVANDDDELESFLVLDEGAPFIEWELQFSDGLESQRDEDGRLNDFVDKTVGLVGAPASIVDATIDEDGTNLQLTFMSGNVGDTLREGESKTYDIDGKQYTVTLAFVSDPNSGDTEAKFVVNDEMSRALEKGETDEVGDTRLGVRDILVNAREGIASFYLGAHDVTFTDPTPMTEDFDGTAEVDDKTISDATVQAVGYFQSANETYRLAWVKYRLEADAAHGSTIYISDKDHTLREQLDEPEGLLSEVNIHYHGLLPVTHKDLKITADGDDAYMLSFVNVDGKTYKVPLLSNKNGVWKYGDEDDDLVFAEGASLADHNIGMDDYLLLSNARSGNDADKSVTSVIKYTEYDPSNLVVEFRSMADNSTSKVPLSQDGIGYLIFGTSTFKLNVSSTSSSEPNLSVDLDADGGFSDETKVVAYGGVIINLAQTVYRNESVNVTLGDAAITDVVGNGKVISDLAGFADGDGFVQMNAQVLAKKFDTPTTDETFNWTISQASSNDVDLVFSDTGFDGPLNTDTSNVNYGFIFTEPKDDDDHMLGLTDWGILLDLYTPSNDPSELTMSLPQTIQYTQLFVTIGGVKHDAPPATSEKVNPIAVGIAILDTDVGTPGSENMIVIGGPCVNKVAATLLESGEDCAAGFEDGHAIIRSWEYGDKVVVLIAGYSGQDTLIASRVLAGKKAPLNGTSTEIVTADFSDLDVHDVV